jgi:site-specific DNA recombinase
MRLSRRQGGGGPVTKPLAMARKAQAGHVTGGRICGYDNVDVFAGTPGPDGRPRRACVIRHVNPAEARIVRRLFEEYLAGRGLTRPAKGLNVQHVPPPRARAAGRRRRFARSCGGTSTKASSSGTRPGSAMPGARSSPRAARRASGCGWTRRTSASSRSRSGARRRPDASAPAATFVRAPDGRLLGRPSVEDFESPYLLSGLARCAPRGGALVGLTRAHGRGRRALYGCAYHHKRGAAICANGVKIRQERLETAVLDALRAVLDARMIEEAVNEALTRLRQDGEGRLGRRATVERERSLVEARVRLKLPGEALAEASHPS